MLEFYNSIANKTVKCSPATNKYRVSFCGYFPADNPKYSCIVIIDNPKNGVPSSRVMVGSMFKEIVDEISQ